MTVANLFEYTFFQPEVRKSPGYTYSCALDSSCPFEEIGTVVGFLPVEMKK